ncbi:hypothetical protein LPJ59_002242 [Coemansia sp. RSA 2399]|nr:hypothetical protein LPJ59_002242 [Coemansia sp. RSA 2399]KAJ1905492.1 hypothetical protein LPJ81_001901 [Coemansia sp. IMI 209127]
MHRSNAYLGPYHRLPLTENPNPKDSVVAEQQQKIEARAARPSLTTPLAQTSRSIHVHPSPQTAGTQVSSEHRLPPISSMYEALPASAQHHHPLSPRSGAVAVGPMVHGRQPYHQQPQHHQFSYRNHYQQHQPPPPLMPHLSTASSVGGPSSSPLTPPTPVHAQHGYLHHNHRNGRAPDALPALGSPTVSLSSPSASPVGNGTYAYISNKRTHAETEHTSKMPARKRSRHAWPATQTRQIINVLLDEFLTHADFRTTIYRSREERDHRFTPSGRSILEEYNKIQNMRRRYFIPLSYLLQWDKMRNQDDGGVSARLRATTEKKLAKPLERSRLQMIFFSAMKKNGDEPDMREFDEEDTMVSAADGKPMFELDIFVAELKRRDIQLWSKGVAAFHAWVSRKCSVDFIINH